MLYTRGADIAQLIQNATADGIESQEELYRVAELQSRMIVILHDDMDKVAHELYGNGVPGGLKLAISAMDKRLCDITKRLDKIAADEAEQQNNSTFDRALRWMTDKILPALITSAIMSFFALLFFGAVMMFAWQAGILDILILGRK